jgi:hypothetical protein
MEGFVPPFGEITSVCVVFARPSCANTLLL